MSEFKLTANQQAVFDAVESSDSNFLITGKPGVGKSVLLRHLREHGRKTYSFAAPTGLAALNIDGRTLHSLFRLPVSGGIIAPDYNEFPKDDRVINNIRYNIKYLVIDEISMVRADLFDFIDRLMRSAKGINKPFGGVQIIAVGDFFQLPPVVVRDEVAQLREHYESPFIFSSRVFKDGQFKVMELSEVLRQQGDQKFIKLLDSARTGKIVAKQCDQLNKRVQRADEFTIRLAGTNAQADAINQNFLSSLAGDSVAYSGKKFGEWPALPAEEHLNLKIGAQVMVKMNAADRPENDRSPDFVSEVVNGTIGKVAELHADKVVIKKEDGRLVPIWRKRFERKIKEKDADGKWGERLVASFEQVPLSLAWAISIHKSQGQSFDKVHVDASKIFAPGQLYVALSRCRSLAGLSMESEVNERKFWANRDVVSFFKTYKTNYHVETV